MSHFRLSLAFFSVSSSYNIWFLLARMSSHLLLFKKILFWLKSSISLRFSFAELSSCEFCSSHIYFFASIIVDACIPFVLFIWMKSLYRFVPFWAFSLMILSFLILTISSISSLNWVYRWGSACSFLT